MSTRSRLVPLALLVAASVAAVAGAEENATQRKAPPHADAIAKLIQPIRAEHDVPGMAAAVVTSRGLVALGAAGVRRHGAEAQVTAGDLWHIGSCTKSMTATLIGRLVEKGTLYWDTTLKDAFPKLAAAMHPGWHDVTLSQLLRNRGGAPNGLSRDGLWGRLWRHQGSDTAARRTLLLGVTKHATRYPPESKYEYSNAGFAIAGHVAETLTKTPFETLMRKELFAPLRMQSAGFGAPGNAQTIDQPQGHRIVNGKRVPVPPGPGADNPPAISPAGRVHLTLQDWGRYVSLHLAGARDGKERLLLDRVTLRRLQQGRKGQPYAYGWGKAERPWGGGRVLTHNGSNTMWFAVTWLAPLKDFAVLVACNLGGKPGAQACDEAAGALIRWYARRR